MNPLVNRWVKRILIFHVVCFAWIFFRAQTLTEALGFIRGLGIVDWRPEFWVACKFLALFTIPLFLIDLSLETRDEEFLFQKAAFPLRWAYASGLILIVAFFSANQANAFIYFQF